MVNWYIIASEEGFFLKRGLNPSNANLTEWFLINGYTVTGHLMPTLTPLRKCLDWEDLYRVYPFFENVMVRITSHQSAPDVRALLVGKRVSGVSNWEIWLNPNQFFGAYGKSTTPSRMLRSFAHEVTHIILWEEGKRGLDYGTIDKKLRDQSLGEQQADFNADNFPDGKWPDDWSYV